MDEENVAHLPFIQWTTTQQVKNDNLKFEGKQMDLENTILSEVAQSQEDKYNMYSLISDFLTKNKKTQPTAQNFIEPRQQRKPQERHIWIYVGRRKRQDLLSKFGAWGSGESVEGERRGRKENTENV